MRENSEGEYMTNIHTTSVSAGKKGWIYGDSLIEEIIRESQEVNQGGKEHVRA